MDDDNKAQNTPIFLNYSNKAVKKLQITGNALIFCDPNPSFSFFKQSNVF